MFGFGKGKIENTLDKFNYKPGETIKGKVSLELKKPMKAKRLKLFFYGEKTTRVPVGSAGPGYGSSGIRIGAGSAGGYENRTVRIYSFEKDLDGEKEYTNAEYKFEVAIPQNITTKETLDNMGVLGNIAKFAEVMGARVVPRWYIEAVLDIPLGVDVRKKVQINIA